MVSEKTKKYKPAQKKIEIYIDVRRQPWELSNILNSDWKVEGMVRSGAKDRTGIK